MGSAASTIPMNIDKETFRKLCGNNLNDPLFDLYSSNGLLSREKLFELAQMTDCYLSHDWGFDRLQRNNHNRTGAIGQLLHKKGLAIGFDNEQHQGNQVANVASTIDKARCVAIILTQNYMDKCVGEISNEKCALEYNYAIRKKGVEFCIPIVVDPHLLDKNLWKGPIGLHLKNMDYIDMTDDSQIAVKVEEFFSRILSLTRSPNILRKVLPTATICPPGDTREETQFFEWMARSTKIPENRRIIYGASLVRAGITSVTKLAERIKATKNLLYQLGMNVSDSDEITLALSDLGLLDVPVSEFSQGNSLETATYALNKASQSPNDHVIAANALACVVRICSAREGMAETLHHGGVTPAILKLLKQHLADFQAVTQGLKAIVCLSSKNCEIGDAFVSGFACDICSQAMHSHLNHAEVQQAGCQVIASLSFRNENRSRFGIANACEVLSMVFQKYYTNPKVMEEAFKAVIQLTWEHLENICKLGSFQVCPPISTAIASNCNQPAVLYPGYRAIVQLSLHPDNRISFGDSGMCQNLVQSMLCSLEIPAVLDQGCQAMLAIMVGSAINRQRLGDVGACMLLEKTVGPYGKNYQLLYYLCSLAYELASGNASNQQKLRSLKPTFAQIAMDSSIPDNIRGKAKDVVARL